MAVFRCLLGLTLTYTLGCGPRAAPTSGSDGSSALANAELEYRAEYASAVIALGGQVLARSGEPIAGASVAVGARFVESDANGDFTLAGLPRQNTMLTVSAAGYRVERVPLNLQRPLAEKAVVLEPILLFRSDRTRLTFGGDVQLGRRYLDSTESTPSDQLPKDDPAAPIQASNPGPGTEAVLRYLAPMLSDADYTSANLETVVTDTPSTPDLSNTYVFFTLPGSLPPLAAAGVDYVSNANNHVYDYFDDGLRDTLAAVEAAGLDHSGAGLDADEAFLASHVELGKSRFAMLGFVSIEGIPVRNSTGATDTRSGAADLNDDARITAALQRERDAGYLPIANLHTGYEYSEQPLDEYTTERMEFVADAGAGLVVCHHPHVPQGFEFHDGVLIAHSLGNLVFDQERLETQLGLTLNLDFDGETLENAEARGFFIDEFVPKPVTGAVYDHLLRRVGGSSAPWGTLFVPYGASAWIVPPERASEIATLDRELTLTVHVGDGGFGVLDLRPVLVPGESLLGVTSEDSSLTARIGRDLAVLGDMEDADVDETGMETPIWYTSGLDRARSSYVCQKDAYRGAVSLCSIRDDASTTEASITLRNRLRVLGDKLNLPDKELTLFGYVSGDNAGPVRVEARYYASLDDAEFGGEIPIRLAAGSYPWHAEARDLSMPPDDAAYPRSPEDPYDPELRRVNARALRLFFYQGAPPAGSGIFRVDDIAVISWQETLTLSGASELAVPHARDFVRVEGALGDHELSVRLRRRVPAAAL